MKKVLKKCFYISFVLKLAVKVVLAVDKALNPSLS